MRYVGNGHYAHGMQRDSKQINMISASVVSSTQTLLAFNYTNSFVRVFLWSLIDRHNAKRT